MSMSWPVAGPALRKLTVTEAKLSSSSSPR
jgi:hypothetical protein